VAALHAADGSGVGQAAAYEGPDPWVTVSLDLTASSRPGPGDGRYRVLLRPDRGGSIALGAIVVSGGRGTLSVATSVELASVRVVSVQDPDGHDIFAAVLPG
jgi:hypothetical protein